MSATAALENECHFRPHQYLARENDIPRALFRIVEGWACRFRLLSDGRRQITALFLPGDICEPQWALGRKPAQPVVALTAIRAVRLPCALPEAGSEAQVELWQSLVGIVERQASWLVTLGRKGALERVADLLLDLFARMQAAGLAQDRECPMPLTQNDIADITGLTPVHVNRTLQEMRARGLIELRAKRLHIGDIARLRQASLSGVLPA